MLIPTGFAKLPNDESCYNGVVLMGGVVGQISSGLAQLSNVKSLGESHFQVNHSLWGQTGFGSSTGGNGGLFVLASYKSDREYNFLYQSTPLSTRLAIVFKYAAFENASIVPYVKIKLRSTAGNSYSGTVLDEGIEFESGVHIEDSYRQYVAAREAFTGCELIDAPTNLVYDPPRPLFVPSANRGELLNVQILLASVALSSVHIYDIYEAEVTP